jgi:hypothetical protein
VRKSTIYLFVLGLAVVVVTALASAGLVVSAQNTNSSTTMAPAAAKPKPKHIKKAAPAMPRCDNTKQEQTDLSGTYTGKLKHGDGPAVDATLTVTGNTFTGTMGNESPHGRITAVTTCGYTAVTMMMDGAPTAMSLRAKKVGDSLTMTSVPGEPQMVSFTTGGASMKAKPRPRKHKAKAKATTTTGAATTTPAPTPKAKPAPKPKATPKPKQ